MNALTGANIRDAKLSEIGPLAKIWFDGWQDAHARIVPAQLARQRTLQSFEERLRAASTGVRVAEAGGPLLGFYLLKGAELYQFYVSSNARGSGVAAVLMVDAGTGRDICDRGVALREISPVIGPIAARRTNPDGAAPEMLNFAEKGRTPVQGVSARRWHFSGS